MWYADSSCVSNHGNKNFSLNVIGTFNCSLLIYKQSFSWFRYDRYWFSAEVRPVKYGRTRIRTWVAYPSSVSARPPARTLAVTWLWNRRVPTAPLKPMQTLYIAWKSASAHFPFSANAPCADWAHNLVKAKMLPDRGLNPGISLIIDGVL